MADFAEWVASCEAHFLGTRLSFEGEGESTWRAGDFERAYEENRRDATETVLNADSAGQALLSFMDSRTSWTGTATDLLSGLAKLVEEDARRDKGWPKNGQALSRVLRRLAPALRRSGIHFADLPRSDKKGTRLLSLSHIASAGKPLTQYGELEIASEIASEAKPLKNKEKTSVSDASDASDDLTQFSPYSGGAHTQGESVKVAI